MNELVKQTALTNAVHKLILESLSGDAELKKKELDFALQGIARRFVIKLSGELVFLLESINNEEKEKEMKNV